MENLLIIVGLGNPGREYEGTRHNAGFMVLDALSKEGFTPFVRRGKSLVAEGHKAGKRIYLVKPLTYMNLSGEAVREILGFYKAEPAASLVVVSDDIDLPPGRVRVRVKGSAGSHNGLRNIIACLGTQEFMRIRVGVGDRPDRRMDLADYVLARPRGEEAKAVEQGVERASQAALCLMEDGVDAAMTRFNKESESQ